MIFQPQNARFYLELASRVADRVATEERQYLRRSRTDRILAALQIALESGDLSLEQVAKLAHPDRGHDAFEVLISVQFSRRVVRGLLEHAEVAPLLDEPLLPRHDGPDAMHVSKDSGERRTVTTCREWADARTEGYYPVSNYDNKEEAFFKKAYSMIQAFSRASIADTSFVEAEHTGLDALDLLPVTLLPFLSNDEVKTLTSLDAQGASVGSLMRTGEVKVKEATRNYLSLTYRGMGKAFWAILRADLNGDGIEDVLVSTYEWTTQGTFGFGDITVVTRRGADQRFEIVKGIDLLPSGA